MSKLTEILQPLVDLVPQFRNWRHVVKWTADYFPCGSKAASTVASLAKWKQNVIDYEDHWKLGANTMTCMLCREIPRLSDHRGKHCSSCPLAKFGGSCVDGNAAFAIAVDESDKQPLIDALEKAAVYALVNEFREKCEATVKEVGK